MYGMEAGQGCVFAFGIGVSGAILFFFFESGAWRRCAGFFLGWGFYFVSAKPEPPQAVF
jgi:hypothetical protein